MWTQNIYPVVKHIVEMEQIVNTKMVISRGEVVWWLERLSGEERLFVAEWGEVQVIKLVAAKALREQLFRAWLRICEM